MIDRDTFRRWMKMRPEDLQGHLQCIFAQEHVLERHDMGGGLYCTRCHAGTAVNPSFDLPPLPPEPETRGL